MPASVNQKNREKLGKPITGLSSPSVREEGRRAAGSCRRGREGGGEACRQLGWEREGRGRVNEGKPYLPNLYKLGRTRLIWAFLLTKADVLRLFASENRTINLGRRVKAIRLS